ncbi:MAG: methyltransferase regulatory domain-containing protein [Gammaproteobacteria bacterium]|nr:methyltransferase regulatory domain-containing protein [Gammaproteobacteria bacterium]
MNNSDWNQGYPTDITYTYGYYPEMNPLRSKLPLLNAGITPPKKFANACELGFGQGISSNIHASTSTTRWFANDFNPSHTLFANNLSSAVSNDAHFYNDSFADFLHRKDLPEFDFIGIHGVFSWISPENQKHIVNFINAKLKIGGVLYISYNCNPGWSAFAPLVQLMKGYMEFHTNHGDPSIKRTEQAFEFLLNLANANAGVFRATPGLAERIKKMKEQDIRYLVHEFASVNWKPLYFHEVHESLSQAKMGYACSANILEHIEALHITPDQAKILNNSTHTPFRELLKDHLINQQFRRDYWVRGENKLQPFEHTDIVRGLRVFLSVEPKDITLQISGSLGSVTLNESVYKPILEYLGDNKVHTVKEIETTLMAQGVNLPQIFQSVLILSGMGVLHLAQDEEDLTECMTKAERYNKYTLEKTLTSTNNTHNYLACPYSGGGMPMGRFEQLFLLAYKQGRQTSQGMAAFAWDILKSQGQKLIKSGNVVESEEENLVEMNNLASNFNNKIMVSLKSYGIVR